MNFNTYEYLESCTQHAVAILPSLAVLELLTTVMYNVLGGFTLCYPSDGLCLAGSELLAVEESLDTSGSSLTGLPCHSLVS